MFSQPISSSCSENDLVFEKLDRRIMRLNVSVSINKFIDQRNVLCVKKFLELPKSIMERVTRKPCETAFPRSNRSFEKSRFRPAAISPTGRGHGALGRASRAVIAMGPSGSPESDLSGCMGSFRTKKPLRRINRWDWTLSSASLERRWTIIPIIEAS